MVLFRNVSVLTILICITVVQGKEVRTLELYGFETPWAGKAGPSPGNACEGKLVRMALAAHDGRMGGRLSFKIPAGSGGGGIMWDYPFSVPIREGAKSFSLWVRTNLSRGKLVCSVFDQEEWFDISQPLPAAGQWKKVVFNLDRADFGGRKEKKVKWPIFQIRMWIYEEGEGYVDLDSLSVETEASRNIQPGYGLEMGMDRFGNLLKSGEIPALTLYVHNREKVTPSPCQGTYRVCDWQGRKVVEGKLEGVKIPGQGVLAVPFEVKGIKGSGAFCVTAEVTTTGETSETYRTKAWFGILPAEKILPVPWVGTCLHWTHGWGFNEMRVLDIMREVGIGVVRQDIAWSCMERKSGHYNSWPLLDRFGDELAKHGIKWNFVFLHGNPMYANPLDPDAHARFAGWAAKYFTSVDHFEIWNEPANCNFMPQYGQDKTGRGPWVTKFVEFTNKTTQAIKAARPKATVWVSSEDVFFRLQEMLEKGIGKNADGLAIHTYTKRALRPEAGEFLGDGLKALREYSRKYGGPERVAITEVGWTTCGGENIRYLEWAGKFDKTTYVEQAMYLIRMYLLARAANVEYAMNYDFMNDGPDRSYTEHNFGLIHEDYSPKPSLMAIAAMTRIIGNGKFVRDLSPSPEKYRVYLFEKDGKPVIAAWAVRGKASVSFTTGTDQVEMADLMGNVGTLSIRDKKMDIVLTEVPVYLRGNAIDRIEVKSVMVK
jgi:hypothetical protein